MIGYKGRGERCRTAGRLMPADRPCRAAGGQAMNCSSCNQLVFASAGSLRVEERFRVAKTWMGFVSVLTCGHCGKVL